MNKSKIFAKVADIANKREEKVELSKGEVSLAIPEDLAKQTGEYNSIISETDS